MNQLSLLALYSLFLLSCGKSITNDFSHIAYQCGQSAANHPDYTWIPIDNSKAYEIEAFKVIDSRYEKLMVSENGCLGIDSLRSSEVVVVRSNSAGVFLGKTISRSELDSLRSVRLEAVEQSKLNFNCENITTFAQNRLHLNFSISGNSSLDLFRTKATATDRKLALNRIINLTSESQSNRLSADFSNYADGSYAITLEVKNLIINPYKPQIITCEFTKDTQAPEISPSTKSFSKDLFEEAKDYLQIKPLENLLFDTSDANEHSIFLCIRRPGEICSSFVDVTLGFSAPAGGEYVLEYYAEDKSGNTSPVKSEKLLVYDQEKVALFESRIANVKSLVEKNELFAALKHSLDAYSIYKSLAPSFVREKYFDEMLSVFWSTQIQAELPARVSSKGEMILPIGSEKLAYYRFDAYPFSNEVKFYGRVEEKGAIIKEFSSLIPCKTCFEMEAVLTKNQEHVVLRNFEEKYIFSLDLEPLSIDLPDRCYDPIILSDGHVSCARGKFATLYRDGNDITPNAWENRDIQLTKTKYFVDADGRKVWNYRGEPISIDSEQKISRFYVIEGELFVLLDDCFENLCALTCEKLNESGGLDQMVLVNNVEGNLQLLAVDPTLNYWVTYSVGLNQIGVYNSGAQTWSYIDSEKPLHVSLRSGKLAVLTMSNTTKFALFDIDNVSEEKSFHYKKSPRAKVTATKDFWFIENVGERFAITKDLKEFAVEKSGTGVRDAAVAYDYIYINNFKDINTTLWFPQVNFGRRIDNIDYEPYNFPFQDLFFSGQKYIVDLQNRKIISTQTESIISLDEKSKFRLSNDKSKILEIGSEGLAVWDLRLEPKRSVLIGAPHALCGDINNNGDIVLVERTGNVQHINFQSLDSKSTFDRITQTFEDCQVLLNPDLSVIVRLDSEIRYYKSFEASEYESFNIVGDGIDFFLDIEYQSKYKQIWIGFLNEKTIIYDALTNTISEIGERDGYSISTFSSAEDRAFVVNNVMSTTTYKIVESESLKSYQIHESGWIDDVNVSDQDFLIAVGSDGDIRIRDKNNSLSETISIKTGYELVKGAIAPGKRFLYIAPRNSSGLLFSGDLETLAQDAEDWIGGR